MVVTIFVANLFAVLINEREGGGVGFSHELAGADRVVELGELAVRQAAAVRGRDAPHCFQEAGSLDKAGSTGMLN